MLLRLILSIALISLALSAAADQLTDLQADLQQNPDRIGTRIQLAEFYIKQKKYDKVVSLLNAYTDQLPAVGFRTLGFAYSELGDFENEVRVLNLAAKKFEKNYEWHLLLGQAHLKAAAQTKALEKKKDLTTAGIQALRQALSLQPSFKPAFDLLLATLLQQHANNAARDLINDGLERFGARPELLRELCRLDATDGYLSQAVSNCRLAIRVSPDYPDNYVFLMQALFDQKEDQQAEATASNAGRRFTQSEFVQWAVGTVFLRKKNFSVAQRYFQAALRSDPKSARAHFGLARCQFELNQEIEAFNHFVQACPSDQAHVDGFFEAGGRLKQKGKTSLGEKYVSAASSCKK